MAFGVQRQTAIYLQGVTGRRPRVPVGAQALEDGARRTMSRQAFAYVAGGAGGEATVRANRSAWDVWRIVPRMLRDVGVRDTSVELFGRRLPVPFLLAPVGVLEMAHRDADLAVARAAASEGVGMVLSNQASKPMEAVCAARGDTPRWFQLYWSTSDELVASFVSRAEAAGASAIVVTLETTLLGWRSRDLDLAYLPFLRGKGIAQYTSDPVFRRLVGEALAGAGVPAPAAPRTRPPPQALRALVEMALAHPGPVLDALRSGRARGAVQQFVRIYSRPSLTGDDLPFLREHTSLPI